MSYLSLKNTKCISNKGLAFLKTIWLLLTVVFFISGCKKESIVDNPDNSYIKARIEKLPYQYLNGDDGFMLESKTFADYSGSDCSVNYLGGISDKTLGESFTIMFKGLYEGNCAQQSAAFPEIFQPGTYEFASDTSNGVIISWTDDNGTPYSSLLSSQQKSVFTINSYQLLPMKLFGKSQIRVSGYFKCLMRSEEGHYVNAFDGNYKLVFIEN